MIQRKQTLFFLAALILVMLPLMGTSFFNYFSEDGMEYSYNAYNFKQVGSGPIVLTRGFEWILILIVSLILVLTTISYKNRKRQIQLGWLAFALNVMTSIIIVFHAFLFESVCKTETSLEIEMAFFAFASAFLFIFLGIQGVRKDKKLVDSFNRLR
jgi:hypothetical protein